MTYQISRDRLLSQADLRWREVAERRPELAAAVALQRALVGRGLELAEVAVRDLPADVSLQSLEVAARLARQTPVLAGETIRVDGSHLKAFAIGFCEDLASGDATRPALTLRDKLARDDIDVGSLVSASLGRQQGSIRVKAHHLGVAPDLLWLVAELTAGPIAHRLYETAIAPLLSEHDDIRRLVSEWDEGFCPTCGSWPAFAQRLTDATRRSLLCSFCGSTWRPARHRCIYCGEDGASFITARLDPEGAGRHVELCRECGGYLKSVDVASITPFELVPIEDLATNDLDTGAVERGYGRPSMRVFDSGSEHPCPPPVTD